MIAIMPGHGNFLRIPFRFVNRQKEVQMYRREQVPDLKIRHQIHRN